MAGNILQRSITPVKPKVLDKERIFVYVEEASNNTKGIASFDSNHFLVNAGNVILNTRYLSEAPFDRASLIKLDKDDFKLSGDTTQINWSFAHDKSGSARTNGFGLVKIADNSAGYLKFTDDDNHYLEVDTTKLLNEIDVDTKINNAISTHNSSADAHNDIRELIRNIDSSGKVDKVAGRYYIYNTTSGIKLGSPYVAPGTTSGIFQFLGIDIGDEITIGKQVGGSTSQGSILKFTGYDRPILRQWQDTGDSLESPLAVLKDVSELQTTMTNYVNTKVAEVNAVIIRNTEPNIVIEATEDTVQEVATQYIVNNYGRQPEANDGLFITLTDLDNDVIKYAYFNNSWINVGINKIDLSNYVDIASEQTISGHKNFTGSLTKSGLEVATETLLNSKIEQVNSDLSNYVRERVVRHDESETTEGVYINEVSEFTRYDSGGLQQGVKVPSYTRMTSNSNGYIYNNFDNRADIYVNAGTGASSLRGEVMFMNIDNMQDERANLYLDAPGDASLSRRSMIENETTSTFQEWGFRASRSNVPQTRMFLENYNNFTGAYQSALALLTSERIRLLFRNQGSGTGDINTRIDITDWLYIGDKKVALQDEVEQVDKDARKVLILGGTGTIGTNANFVINDAESFIPFRNNLTEFIMSLIVPVTGEVDLTKEVTIDFGDTSYYLFDAIDTSRRLTLGDLNFALKESLVTGYNYLFRAVFFENSDAIGFAVLPDRDQVLSLTSDQMDNYIAEGGLPNGQLVICSRVITNGYTEGGIYRFKITYPDTYEFVELSTGGSGGGTSVKVYDITSGSVNEVEYKGVVLLTANQAKLLAEQGGITIGDQTFVDDGSYTFYTTNDQSLGELTLTTSGTVITSSEQFTSHVRIMIEFETDGMHYGADFVLHPYDTSICFVSYNFVGHSGTAYLDENGYVKINIPDDLTFTNIKGHFVELGG